MHNDNYIAATLRPEPRKQKLMDVTIHFKDGRTY